MSRTREPKPPLIKFYDSIQNDYEICLDEVARGPLFGRLYVSAVVLPKETNFDGSTIKDSKKFTSKKKIREVAEYIREHALVWHIHYIEASVIDEINILQSVLRGMHECVRVVLAKLRIIISPSITPFICDNPYFILVDGDRFRPYCHFNEETGELSEIPHITVEQGDAKYMGIAAASIIAKVAHDEYIADLCAEYPELSTRYQLDKNVGYGTSAHLTGIREWGITQWHRQSYGPCKTAAYNPV